MEQNNAYNGIRIIDSMNLSVPKSRRILNIIPLVLITFSGICGTIVSFSSMFGISMTFKVKLAFMLTFAAFIILFVLPRKFQLAALPAILLYVAMLYRKWKQFTIGFKTIFNTVYSVIYPDKHSYFRISSTSLSDEEVFLIFAVILLTLAVCYFTLIHPSFFMGFLCTFPVIETGLYFGKSPKLIPALMLVIYWVCLLAVNFSGYGSLSDKAQSGFFRKDNKFTAKPVVRFRTSGLTSLFLIFICCAVFAATSVFIKVSDFSRSDKTNQLRTNMKTAASEFTFEDLGTSLERFSASFGIGNFKMYNHKLGDLNKVTFNEKTDLTVYTDSALAENIYLKGYVGAVYSKNSWEEFSDELYKQYDGMFSEFYQNKTFPQDMLTDYMLEYYLSDFVNMEIKSGYRNEKYNYTPYSSVPDGEITYIDDTIVKLDNFRDYSFRVTSKQVSRDNFQDFLNNYHGGSINEQYTEFVHENYCKVPDNSDMQALYSRYISDSGISDMDLYGKLDYIRNILAENAEYSLTPGKTPSSEDFVSYFLNENHKGYCVHFATSGVVLARMAGIPARYAEGYVLLSDDFSDENKRADGSYKVDIKDNRAHAWAEIYIDGLGWIPYEFTPSSAAAFNSEGQTAETQQATTETVTTAVLTETTTETTLTTNVSSEFVSESTVGSSVLNSEGVLTGGSADSTNNGSAVSEKKMSPVAVAVIIIISVLIIAVLCIVLRRFYKIRKRIRSMQDKSNKDMSVNAYNYIVQLLEYCGIRNENMQYIEYADYVENNTDSPFEKGEFVKATHTALKAKLSGNQPDNDETEFITGLAYSTARKIYDKSSIFRKIYMKFIKALI